MEHNINTDTGIFGHMNVSLSLFSPSTISGKSALHWAAAVNNVEATLVLLKNGANRDMQDNKVGSRPDF